MRKKRAQKIKQRLKATPKKGKATAKKKVKSKAPVNKKRFYTAKK